MTDVSSLLLAVVAQGIPLAPPLQTRVIALVIVEAFLITTSALLYVRWIQLKREPLDEWWAERRKRGFSARTRALMEESERERREAEAQSEDPATGAPGAAAD